MTIGHIGVLAKPLVCGENVGDYIAAIQLLALRRRRAMSIVARTVVHFGIPDIRIERAHLDAENPVVECRRVPGDVVARIVYGRLDPHGPVDGLARDESDRNEVVVLAGVHRISQHQRFLVGQTGRAPGQFLGGSQAGHKDGHQNCDDGDNNQ